VEAAGGAVLLLAAIVTLSLANSRFSEAYLSFWQTPLAFEGGGFHLRDSIQPWIDDGLMAVFFRGEAACAGRYGLDSGCPSTGASRQIDHRCFR
jgi:hypothetical protein